MTTTLFVIKTVAMQVMDYICFRAGGKYLEMFPLDGGVRTEVQTHLACIMMTSFSDKNV
jgi:hypothetical protein